MLRYLVVGAVFCLCGWIAAGRNAPMMDKQSEDAARGYFTNCGGINFTLWWEPKVISTTAFFMAHLSFVPNVTWAKGYARVKINIGGRPFLQTTQVIDCAKLLPFTTTRCPFKKGAHVEMQYSGSGGILIPGETINVHAEILDKDQKGMLCAQATIKIKDVDEEDLDRL